LVGLEGALVHLLRQGLAPRLRVEVGPVLGEDGEIEEGFGSVGVETHEGAVVVGLLVARPPGEEPQHAGDDRLRGDRLPVEALGLPRGYGARLDGQRHRRVGSEGADGTGEARGQLYEDEAPEGGFAGGIGFIGPATDGSVAGGTGGSGSVHCDLLLGSGFGCGRARGGRVSALFFGPRLAHLAQKVVDMHLEGHRYGLLVEVYRDGRQVLTALDVLVADDRPFDVQALARIVHLDAQHALLADEEFGEAHYYRLGPGEGEIAEDALSRHSLHVDVAFLGDEAEPAHRVGIEEDSLVPPPRRVYVRLEEAPHDVDEVVGGPLRVLEAGVLEIAAALGVAGTARDLRADEEADRIGLVGELEAEAQADRAVGLADAVGERLLGAYDDLGADEGAR